MDIFSIEKILTIIGIITGVATIVYYFHKYVVLKIFTWTTKKTIDAISAEVIKNLDIEQKITNAFDRYMKPNGGSSIYDKLQDIQIHQKTFHDFMIRNEQMNRSMLNAQNISFWESDSNGKCVYASPQLCSLMGRSESELLGSNWVNCVYEDDRTEVSDQWRWVIENASKFNMDYRIETSLGDIITVHGQAYALKNFNGSIMGFFGTLNKISTPTSYSANQ